MKKILILGAEGMLGHVLFRWLANKPAFDVYATTLLDPKDFQGFSANLAARLKYNIDLENIEKLRDIFSDINPDVVINCAGFVSIPEISKNQSSAINVNARLPHCFALICKESNSKFIQISSDIVFDGKKGMYSEHDQVNVLDLYGATKLLGEVAYPNCITLRTSIIGHKLIGNSGLVEWILSQRGKVRGYTKAIYSGFPTIELAEIISDYILPNDKLSGILHVSSNPITKHDLLKLIVKRYDRKIEVEPYDEVALDRSLDSSVFRSLTGYIPPTWEDLIDKMYCDHEKHDKGNSKTQGD